MRIAPHLIAFAGLIAACAADAAAGDLIDNSIIQSLPRQAAYELHLVLDRIESQLRKGRRSEKQLGAELLALDKLIAHHSGTDTEAAGTLTLVKAMLYLNPLEQPETSIRLLEQLREDYPHSVAALAVDGAMAKARARARGSAQ